MSTPSLACADTTLRQISTDSADAARWRLFCYVTGWTGGAHEAAVRWNEREAQLAQYGKALDAVVSGKA